MTKLVNFLVPTKYCDNFQAKTGCNTQTVTLLKLLFVLSPFRLLLLSISLRTQTLINENYHENTTQPTNMYNLFFVKYNSRPFGRTIQDIVLYSYSHYTAFVTLIIPHSSCSSFRIRSSSFFANLLVLSILSKIPKIPNSPKIPNFPKIPNSPNFPAFPHFPRFPALPLHPFCSLCSGGTSLGETKAGATGFRLGFNRLLWVMPKSVVKTANGFSRSGSRW